MTSSLTENIENVYLGSVKGERGIPQAAILRPPRICRESSLTGVVRITLDFAPAYKQGALTASVGVRGQSPRREFEGGALISLRLDCEAFQTFM